MAEVQILVPGYLAVDSGGRTCPTVTLVQDREYNIIVDPGTVPSFDLIVQRLAENNLKPEDINLVFLTHSHYDHFRNVGLFKNAKVLDYWGIWDNDRIELTDGKITENIEALKTPGHSADGLTFFVKTAKGVVAICGDVFWKKDAQENDPYAVNQKQLDESRKLVLGRADWIIPGHGDIYQVKK